MKIENLSRKRRHELNGIGIGRIKTFPFFSDYAYDLVALHDGVANRKGRANQCYLIVGN